MIVRLNRYLSICGVSSRRKADELIAEGKVRVNGALIKELGHRIDTDKDKVQIDGRVIASEAKRYIALNKPRLYITALGEGEDDKKTIEELITGITERVYPVGRLDYDSEGLLILTNDGELANRIHHPRYKLIKIYMALVEGIVNEETVKKMTLGIKLQDGYAKPDSVKIIKYQETETLLEISFHEGRNHLVKRFLEEFGHPVVRLKRTAIGNIKLVKLQKGDWRDLTEKELTTLRKSLKLT